MLKKFINFHLRDPPICYGKIPVTQHKKLQTAQGLTFKSSVSWNSQSWKLRPCIQKKIYYTCCSPICDHFPDLEQLLQFVIILPQLLILLSQFIKTRVASILINLPRFLITTSIKNDSLPIFTNLKWLLQQLCLSKICSLRKIFF